MASRKSNFVLPSDDGGTTTAGLHIPTTAETFSITNKQHQAVAAARIADFALSQGTAHPDVLREGKQWYATAHAGLQSTRGDMPMRTAAGIAAVASPGSDWEGRNKHVLPQIAGLERGDWQLIHETHKAAVTDVATRRAAGEAGRHERPKRHEEVAAMLSEKAPMLSAVSDRQLLKGHALLMGAHPEDVMPRDTSPKTNAFYKGLLHPGHRGSQIPIDYRMHDIAANTMMPYESSRQLRAAPYTKKGMRGTQTPYEAHESLVAQAGQAIAMRGGRQFASFARPLGAQQAIWALGKHFEMNYPGAKTGQGPTRTGQRYWEG